jgi:membrane protease YdiL (CAAX protease family)
MTAQQATARASGRPGRDALVLLTAIGALAIARPVFNGSTPATAFATGAVLAAALAAVAVSARGRGGLILPRIDSRLAGALLVGAAAGGALVAVSLAAHGATPVGVRLEPFALWAVLTIGVATAEEAVFRGVLFKALERSGGLGAAVVVSTLAFAAFHVPLYGPQALLPDLAAGLLLGGLRVATGGVAAPAAAHVIADLATWWL